MGTGQAGGGGTRALKFVTIVMGVLILVGTTVVVVTIVKRSVSGPSDYAGLPEKVVPPETVVRLVLDEPAGTSIVGIVSLRDRLAVQLRGGGVDRVLLINPVSGATAGTISLTR
jgi:hypothetical protein